MHVLIITDLEGISGVDSIDMIPCEAEDYKKACEYLMADLNAAVDGAFLGGATKVTVVDGHGSGMNFRMDLLDKRATVLPVREFIQQPGEAYSYDALMCVGAHAMAGTEQAFLDHTESSVRWFEYRINGTPCGEMAMEAYALGAFGIPFVMMSGDQAACEEAETLVPGIATATVKRARERNRAECIPQKEALKRIRNAAKAGVQKTGRLRPQIPTLPAEISITFCRNDYCDSYFNEKFTRKGRTLTKTIAQITGYRDFF